MKKSLLFVLLMSLGVFSEAQINPHAIGLRLRGDGHGNGAEISYQHGFGSTNRLELDFGGRNHKDWNHINVAIIYHWVKNLTDGLNWYIGPGGSIGSYRSKKNSNDGLTLAVGGQIGIEYDFNTKDVPILLSFDWRPMWNLNGNYDNYDNFGYEGGLSIRYIF